MKALALLLLIFLGIGLFARTYNSLVRALLIASILAVVIYVTFL